MDEFRRRPVNKVSGEEKARKSAASTSIPPIATSSSTSSSSLPPVPSSIAPQPLEAETGISALPPKKSRKRFIWWGAGVLVALLLVCVGALIWYNAQLAPVDAGDTTKKLVLIESGSTPTDIANTLHDEGLVRNATVFLWYTRLEGVQNNLQAGTYRLSPSESMPQIVEHLVKGNVDTFNITFLPGATLADNRKVLLETGYTAEEVDAALTRSYDSPLFAGKPANADLEGYIYGETYTFGTNTSVETILEHTFAQFYGVVQKNNLVEAYKVQGLSLYEGITFASIIQKEAGSTPDDMAQISQVFHTRLAIGMPMGSDPTYQYIADKLGVPRDTNIDSPYNTRRYSGLPPGPIATAGEKALIAAAHPASGDYLFFLSGDDDVTYFAHTLEEHERNRVNHCQKKCQIL